MKKLEPEKLLAYVKAHPDATHAEIAEHFGCKQAAICKLFKKHGIPRIRVKKIDPEKLLAYVKAHPDASQAKIAEHFGCSQVAISQALRKAEKNMPAEEEFPYKLKVKFARHFGCGLTNISDALKKMGMSPKSALVYLQNCQEKAGAMD